MLHLAVLLCWLLIVDEIGYQPLSREQVNLLFQIVTKRYKRGSIAPISSLSFGG